MKFTFAVSKLKKGDTKRAMGHNLRTHDTNSQLRKEAWFDSGAQTGIVPTRSSDGYRWNQHVIDRAEGLAKRKDAVVALEFVLQIGNQTDWREPPTKAVPEGKPKKIEQSFLVPFFEQAIAWVDKEFGRENLVSLQLHTDESTPHMHIVVTPVTKEEKLQAKKWLDGASRVGSLRKRCHEIISQKIKCEYTPNSGVGGNAHDVSKRAGMAPAPGITEKLTNKKKIADLTSENETLAKRVDELEKRLRYREKAYYNKSKLEDAELAISTYDELKNEIEALNNKLLKTENDFKGQIKFNQDSIKDLCLDLDKEKTKVATLEKNNDILADQNNDMIEQLRQENRHTL